jgi:hypothetical protein
MSPNKNPIWFLKKLKKLIFADFEYIENVAKKLCEKSYNVEGRELLHTVQIPSLTDYSVCK